jgi:hypothetical protein
VVGARCTWKWGRASHTKGPGETTTPIGRFAGWAIPEYESRMLYAIQCVGAPSHPAGPGSSARVGPARAGTVRGPLPNSGWEACLGDMGGHDQSVSVRRAILANRWSLRLEIVWMKRYQCRWERTVLGVRVAYREDADSLVQRWKHPKQCQLHDGLDWHLRSHVDLRQWSTIVGIGL